MGFLDNYEDVAARIRRFWETHPTGRIENEIVEFNAEKGYVLVRSLVFKEYEDEKPSAIDYAFGNVATYNVQMKKFFVEDTVTSSIGRAIGLLLGTEKRPTRQDMEKVETISAQVAKSTADDYDPWAIKNGDVPSYKSAAEAEQAGIPSLGSSMDEIAKQLGGELIEAAPQCKHGHRVWKQQSEANVQAGKKNWGGYFCVEKSKENQCEPYWYVFGSNGKWRAQ
jgi:hypothetical protein